MGQYSSLGPSLSIVPCPKESRGKVRVRGEGVSRETAHKPSALHHSVPRTSRPWSLGGTTRESGIVKGQASRGLGTQKRCHGWSKKEGGRVAVQGSSNAMQGDERLLSVGRRGTREVIQCRRNLRAAIGPILPGGIGAHGGEHRPPARRLSGVPSRPAPVVIPIACPRPRAVPTQASPRVGENRRAVNQQSPVRLSTNDIRLGDRSLAEKVRR
ncbi:uncharacterized protein LY79DRAFT_239388 [Colletotrichum navitas]|uniref:Uncharacterized protein n=1 Tax=Colletotrichum navitas TaxID=681940 RepID=A0AAD8PX65_9PEZI|nr:uncharacterized protein LY79DRAFT_239388 [Colletotrichum navitas]KAK1589736.1 hypothetical protein LY79DRAFT_239388 [Colletotrichum navitas]